MQLKTDLECINLNDALNQNTKLENVNFWKFKFKLQ